MTASDAPEEAPAGDLATRLHSVAIHLLRRLRREDDALGISAPRLSALSVVVFGGPCTLGALAVAEQVTPPTITRLIASLERDGLVERTADARDGRVTRVAATAKGRAMLEEGRRRRTQRLTAQLRTLTAGELQVVEQATALLERLLREQG